MPKAEKQLNDANDRLADAKIAWERALQLYREELEEKGDARRARYDRAEADYIAARDAIDHAMVDERTRVALWQALYTKYLATVSSITREFLMAAGVGKPDSHLELAFIVADLNLQLASRDYDAAADRLDAAVNQLGPEFPIKQGNGINIWDRSSHGPNQHDDHLLGEEHGASEQKAMELPRLMALDSQSTDDLNCALDPDEINISFTLPLGSVLSDVAPIPPCIADNLLFPAAADELDLPMVAGNADQTLSHAEWHFAMPTGADTDGVVPDDVSTMEAVTLADRGEPDLLPPPDQLGAGLMEPNL